MEKRIALVTEDFVKHWDARPEVMNGKTMIDASRDAMCGWPRKARSRCAGSCRKSCSCDMWLTGFDPPSLQTLYVDKPMRSHGLMQAIARVGRVFEINRLDRISPHRREFDLRAENHYYGAPFR